MKASISVGLLGLGLTVVLGTGCDGLLDSKGVTRPTVDSGVDAGNDAGPGPLPTLEVFASKTVRPPTIDGLVDDTSWELSNTVARPILGTNDNTVTFGVLWDDTYLYVGTRVLDNNLVKDSLNPWLDDAIEVYVDPEHNHSTIYDSFDRQFIKRYNDPGLASPQDATGVLHATASIPGGYSVELAIPWTTLGMTPAAKKTIGFDIHQDDDDTGGDIQNVLGWNDTVGPSYQSTAGFGHLTLSAQAVGGGGGAVGGGGGATGGGGGATGGGGGATGGGGGGATGGGGVGGGPQWQQVLKRTQAQKTAGLAGGEGWQAIFGIAYAPSNPNIVWLVTDTSQLWKSTDGGTNWQRKANGFYANGALSVAIDPSNENTVFAAGSVMSFWAEIPGTTEGVFRTTDGGSNWALVKTAHFHRTYGFRAGSHIVFAGSAIYAGPSTGGLLKSTDGGATWTLMSKAGGGDVLDTFNVWDMKVHPTNNAVLYVSTDNGLYRVVEGVAGATVVPIGTTGLPAQGSFQIDKNNPDVIYVAAGSSGVFRSTDGGLTFGPRNNGLASALSMGGKTSGIAISPSDPSRLSVGFTGFWGLNVYSTTNGGADWTQALSMDSQNADGWVAGSVLGMTSNNSFASNTVISLVYHPANASVALVSGAGEVVKKTTDGGRTWGYSSSGYTGSMGGGASAIGWDPLDSKRAAYFHSDFGALMTESNEDVFRSIVYYGRVIYNNSAATHAGAIRGNIIVTAVGQYQGSRMHVSRDSGETWAPVPGTEDADFFFVSFHPQDNNIVYAGRYRFHSIQTNDAFRMLARPVAGVFKGDGNIVYSNGGVSVGKSTDGGLTWLASPFPAPSIPSGYSIGGIAIDPVNENRVYAAVNGVGVYVITNTIANGGVAQLKNEAQGLMKDQFGIVSTGSIVVDPNNPAVVYAGAFRASVGQSNGVFRSTDSGNSWRNINGNLGSAINITSLMVNPLNSYVYLGSFAGTWKLPPPP